MGFTYGVWVLLTTFKTLVAPLILCYIGVITQNVV